MKKFITFIFASCLGTLLAGTALFGILFLIGAIAGAGDKVKVNNNSVLTLDFSKAVPEKTNNVAQDAMSFNFDTDKTLGLYDMTRTIKMAKDDDKIKGIYMDISGTSMGSATASVVREALVDFKDSGKFIYAYSDAYTQGAYYMASVSDSIMVHPLGSVDFRGFSASIPFFKDMLDKVGVKMQIFYVGNFKSATEPFRRNDMSPENRLQVTEYLTGLYNVFLTDISASRNISVDKLQEVADGYLLREAEDAMTMGFVDKIAYRDEMIDMLKERMGVEEDKKVKTISVAKYSEQLKSEGSVKDDRIAVVFAEGSIVDGEGTPGSIGGKKYAKLIRKIRKDDKVKAIVMRVNSGGGSAFASEEIWRELEKAKEQGITVIASMGDVAASGGYYISANADAILAEENTITGSIGVFGMIPSAEKAMKEKVGVSFDNVKTAEYAVGISPFQDISAGEGEIIQDGVEKIYDIFLERVSEGRGMTTEQVHEVAQGRVWTGKKAKELGLVDIIGGLDDAIALAAEKAEIENYKVKQYPTVKEPLQAFIEELTGQKVSTYLKHQSIKDELGEEALDWYIKTKELREAKGVQARMPFEIIVK